jgi:hypothetical protein
MSWIPGICSGNVYQVFRITSTSGLSGAPGGTGSRNGNKAVKRKPRFFTLTHVNHISNHIKCISNYINRISRGWKSMRVSMPKKYLPAIYDFLDFLTAKKISENDECSTFEVSFPLRLTMENLNISTHKEWSEFCKNV